MEGNKTLYYPKVQPKLKKKTNEEDEEGEEEGWGNWDEEEEKKDSDSELERKRSQEKSKQKGGNIQSVKKVSFTKEYNNKGPKKSNADDNFKMFMEKISDGNGSENEEPSGGRTEGSFLVVEDTRDKFVNFDTDHIRRAQPPYTPEAQDDELEEMWAYELNRYSQRSELEKDKLYGFYTLEAGFLQTTEDRISSGRRSGASGSLMVSPLVHGSGSGSFTAAPGFFGGGGMRTVSQGRSPIPNISPTQGTQTPLASEKARNRLRTSPAPGRRGRSLSFSDTPTQAKSTGGSFESPSGPRRTFGTGDDDPESIDQGEEGQTRNVRGAGIVPTGSNDLDEGEDIGQKQQRYDRVVGTAESTGLVGRDGGGRRLTIYDMLKDPQYREAAEDFIRRKRIATNAAWFSRPEVTGVVEIIPIVRANTDLAYQLLLERFPSLNGASVEDFCTKEIKTIFAYYVVNRINQTKASSTSNVHLNEDWSRLKLEEQ